jgi:hypothetical protein
LRQKSNNLDERNKEYIKDFLDTELVILSIASVELTPEAPDTGFNSETLIKVLNKNYSEESQHIIRYLTMLRKPKELIGLGFR